MERQRQSCLPRLTAASTECPPAWFHPRICLLAYIRNVLSVSMVRSAGSEILGRTARYFCRYRFSIPTTTMKAILRPPILTSPKIRPMRRQHNKLRSRPPVTRSDDELRAAYLQGARDAMNRQADSRYGEHYMDSRERRRNSRKRKESLIDNPSQAMSSEAQAPAPVEDKSTRDSFHLQRWPSAGDQELRHHGRNAV